jgi:hypothetical protein
MRHLTVALLFLNVFAFVSASPAASNHNIPDTVVIDSYRLADAKERLRKGDHELSTALKHLTVQAEYWMTQGPWSVTTKSKAPPGGDVHDYASQAPYWWPSNSSDGCPYVQRDGVRNPEVDNYPDHGNRGLMFNSSYILTLAWYYSGKDYYAKHAGDILRTWFLNPSTRMNPNLNHAQIIPCANTGRAIGIIDFSQEYTNVIDAAAILAQGAPGWSKADSQGFAAWNLQFLQWLTESDFGKSEAGAGNNHGTFANMQIATIALFVGNKQLTTQTTLKDKAFIDLQIRPNGSQPQELARTRSWHYSNFNLGAHLRFALIAKKLGVDLYKYKGPEDQSLFGATDLLIPAAVKGQASWPYPELSFSKYAATDNIRGAADAGDKKAKQVVGLLEPPPGGDIYVLRPAPEQLDNIANS